VEITYRVERPTIVSRRLVLRPLAADDVTPAYVAWLNDPQVNRWLEVRFSPQTAESVADYVATKDAAWERSRHLGVFDEGGTRHVGTVTLPSIDWKHGAADLSFVIGRREVWGQGYASEAVHAACYYAFRECGLHKLWAGYYDGHQGSAKVLERCGFQVEGRLCEKLVTADGQRVDHVLVGLLARDFEPREDLLGPVPAEAE
jgi:RimJ/RimL family protein N-acetyltransferase